MNKYRNWFWLIGLIVLLISLLSNSFEASAYLFVVGIASFAFAMGIDNFFHERPPFNLAGFLLWILGAYIMACLFMSLGIILPTLFP